MNKKELEQIYKILETEITQEKYYEQCQETMDEINRDTNPVSIISICIKNRN